MSTRALTGMVYLALALLLVVADLLGRRTRSSIPTLAEVVTWSARRRSAQIGFLFVWWWLGWHFVLGA